MAKWSKHRLVGASRGHMRLTPEDAELDRFIVLLQKKTDKGIHQCESRNYEPSTNHKGQHFTTKFPFKMEK